jgi:hypothetical protein
MVRYYDLRNTTNEQLNEIHRKMLERSGYGPILSIEKDNRTRSKAKKIDNNYFKLRQFIEQSGPPNTRNLLGLSTDKKDKYNKFDLFAKNKN